MRNPARLHRALALAAALVLSFTVGCAKNPVTGDRDLMLVSEDWELSIGAQQYAPLRQSQGGDYVVDPAVEAYVNEVGQRLARVSDRKLPYEFNVINSSVPNAWALPGGKISINRGLLTELENEAELAAVLGHEIVHAAARHGAQGQSRGVLLQGAVIGASIAGSKNGYGELAQFGSMIGAQLINSRYGRDAELESDRYGMQYMSRAGYNPVGAVQLQKTFVEMSEGKRQDFISGLFASHPPSTARVAANQKYLAELGNQGELGAERYRRAMARMKRAEPAYEKFDEAQQALQKGDKAKARALINEAIRLEPNEGHFQSLRGDIAVSENDMSTAKRYYDKAISLNNDFFYYYLQRGNVYKATRNLPSARADYERSMKLLPTSDAQAGLGDLALAGGDRQTAANYYNAAAQGSGASAAYAKEQLNKLQGAATQGASATPGAVAVRGGGVEALQVRKARTDNGTVAVQLQNRSRQAVGNIVLEISVGGSSAVKRFDVPRALPAGGTSAFNTGLRIRDDQMKDLNVRVVGADLLR